MLWRFLRSILYPGNGWVVRMFCQGVLKRKCALMNGDSKTCAEEPAWGLVVGYLLEQGQEIFRS